MKIRAIHLIIIAAVLVFLPGNAQAFLSFDSVKKEFRKSEVALLDRHGEVIHELRVDPGIRRLEWKSLRDMSPSLLKTVIHSEDRNFYAHNGVDWMALSAAALTNIFGSNPRGASTITMQLASALETNLKAKAAKKRTIGQKWDQIKAAQILEKTWTKEQILEAYLNLVSFRGELQGITAASKGLFGKEPSGLNEDEAALLAALIRSPNAPNDAAAKRACRIAESLKMTTTCESITACANERLSGSYNIRQEAALAPQVAYKLLRRDSGDVHTTLDAGLQRFASESLRYQTAMLFRQNAHDGAVLVADNKTGDILAYVANTGSSGGFSYVDGITAKRQAGSTLKPFLYGVAIEKKILTASSMLDDSPLNIPTQTGLYVPHNYSNGYYGLVSVRTGLSSSINIPAVRTLMLVGTDAFVERLRCLGFENLKDGDYYGYSMALGSVDVSLYELVNAFRTLANKGRWSPLRMRLSEKIGHSRSVMSPDAAFIISDILSDRSARSLTFGFEKQLATGFWTAVKTGTSKDMRDNWCIGYSERFTVGVWVGNFSGEPMWNVSGVSGAAPVWNDIMRYLHRSSGSKRPAKPAGVTEGFVLFRDKTESDRKEYFIKGTETESVSVEKKHGETFISYPADGTIVALDPDIPEENQVMLLEANVKDGFIWLLNNENIMSGDYRVFWKPKAGDYAISLADRQGNIIDMVKFQVRGGVPVERRSE